VGVAGRRGGGQAGWREGGKAGRREGGKAGRREGGKAGRQNCLQQKSAPNHSIPIPNSKLGTRDCFRQPGRLSYDRNLHSRGRLGHIPAVPPSGFGFFPSPDSQLRTPNFFPASGLPAFRLLSFCSSPATSCELPATGSWLPAPVYGLRTTVCRPPTLTSPPAAR